MLLIGLFTIKFLFYFIYASITFLLRKFHVLEILQFKAGLDIDNNPGAFIKIALIAPVFEETLFRLNLKSNSLKLAIGISILILSIFFLFFDKDLSDNYSLYLSYLSLTSLIFYFFLKRYDYVIEKTVENNIQWVFYSSAILFGLIHLDNYDLTNVNPFASLFYIVPHTVAGFFLGYIRMKLGFWYGCLFHGISNAITFLPAIFF